MASTIILLLSLIGSTSVALATVPVGFASQPDAPAELVLTSCDASSGKLAPMRAQGTTLTLGDEPAILQVGVITRRNVPITAVRIGNVRIYEPHGSARAPWHSEPVAITNECGAAIFKQFFAETPGPLNTGGVWLYIGEVVFADGQRWSIGSKDDEAQLQKDLASFRMR